MVGKNSERSSGKAGPCRYDGSQSQAQIIRIFVSSPEEVSEERAALEELRASINRTDGQERGFDLKLFQSNRDFIPQMGHDRQQVLAGQKPRYDIYLRIMSTRFGAPNAAKGSGTEEEFNEALEDCKNGAVRWVTIYFNEQPALSSEPADVEQSVVSRLG